MNLLIVHMTNSAIGLRHMYLIDLELKWIVESLMFL